MAGRVSTKSKDNFEKIKREMTLKKQRARIQQHSEKLQTDTENRDLMRGTSTEWSMQDKCKSIEAVIENTDKGTSEVIVFKVDEEEFALRVSDVKEIIRVPLLRKISNAPQYIMGLCSLRGDLLPIIDSRKLFGMSHREIDDKSRIIVTDIHGKKVGLLCDKVSEVIKVEEVDIKKTPGSINEIDEGFIESIVILNNGKRVVMFLDAEKVTKIRNLQVGQNEQHTSVGNLKGLEIKKDEDEQIVTFNIGTGEYGVNINYVKEIIRLPDIMKVPNTSSYIEGVFSSRNQLQVVVNLGKLLNMNCKQLDDNCRVVIINNGNFSFGVIVDKVSQVMDVNRKLFKENSDIAHSSYVKGIYNLNKGKRLIMMLDPMKIIGSEEVKGIYHVDHKKAAKDKSLYVAEEDNNSEHIVVFKLGEEEYGIEIDNVQEINRMGEITRFPGAPIFITGMVNLREDVIPILNFRTLVNVHDSGIFEASKFLVVEFKNKKIGIIIDSASEVLRFSKSYIEETTGVFDVNNNYIDSATRCSMKSIA